MSHEIYSFGKLRFSCTSDLFHASHRGFTLRSADLFAILKEFKNYTLVGNQVVNYLVSDVCA